MDQVQEVQEAIPKSIINTGSLSFSGRIYHRENVHSEAHEIELVFSNRLKTEEAMAGGRKCKTTEEWSEIDYGWLKDQPISCVVIKNLAGEFQQTILTPEEKAALAEKILILGYEGCSEGFVIKPGQTLPYFATDFTKLRIRCASGECPYKAFIIPG